MTGTTGRRATAAALLAAGLSLGNAGPALAAPPTTHDWTGVAQCESGGNWSINTGNGYHGGLQFSASSWAAAGGTQYAPQADQATPAQQQAAAETLLRMQGIGAWPVCGKYLTTGTGSTGTRTGTSSSPPPTSPPPTSTGSAPPSGSAATAAPPTPGGPRSSSGSSPSSPGSSPAEPSPATAAGSPSGSGPSGSASSGRQVGGSWTVGQSTTTAPWSQYGPGGWGQSSSSASAGTPGPVGTQPTGPATPDTDTDATDTDAAGWASGRGAWEASGQWNRTAGQAAAAGQQPPAAPGEDAYAAEQATPEGTTTGTAVGAPSSSGSMVDVGTATSAAPITTGTAGAGRAPAPAAGHATVTNSAGPLTSKAQAMADAVASSGCPVQSMGGTRSSAIDPAGHPSGNAVDFMVGLGNKAAGDCVANFLIANWARLGMKYVIWQQAILQSPTGQWQPMADRGDPTANHRDHVHGQVG